MLKEKTYFATPFINLSESLPLRVPKSLMIDPGNVCNFKCVFCPTGDPELLQIAGRPRGQMSLELFQKTVDGLREFGEPIKFVHLYKDGEPLANKHFADMVRYAKQSGLIERVETTSNGALLTQERCKAILDAGLDGIRVSIYATDDEGYRNVPRTQTTFETVRGNVENLFKTSRTREAPFHLHCKIVDAGMSEVEKEKFYEIFIPIADSVHIDTIMGWSNTENRDMTLGLDPQTSMSGGVLDKDRKVCSEPFTKLAVNWNGRVSVCCVDWAWGTIVGDTNTETLFDIWNGEPLREFRIKHLEGRRNEIHACRGCQFVQGLAPHNNLDNDAAHLLPLYKN